LSTVVLLGPQGETPDIGPALAEHGIAGKVALITAGLQDRESDDAALVAALGGVSAVNLKLHARAADVFDKDPELAAAYQARQLRFRNIQSFYRVRLEKADEAARMISVRYVEPELLEQEDRVSVDQLRQLDVDHLDRCIAIRQAYEARWNRDRPAIAGHRAELASELETCNAIVIAGGHVASLFNRIRLFDVLGLAAGKPVFAWSAGAMVLADRIVLFHDYPPYGSDIAQVLDAGFGLAPRVVVLPDPKRRIRMDDKAGIARFARRMLPASCVAMDHGARLVFEDGMCTRAVAVRLGIDGSIAQSGAA